MNIDIQNLELHVLVKGANIPLTQENKQTIEREEGDDDEGRDDRDEENNKIKLNTWNHVAITYDNSQQKKLLIYLNCILVASSESMLPIEIMKDQPLYLGKEKLNADITEFRFWNVAKSLPDIKEQYRMPLEIVYEKKREFKMKLKLPGDKGGLVKPGGLGLPAPHTGGLPGPGGLAPPSQFRGLPTPKTFNTNDEGESKTGSPTKITSHTESTTFSPPENMFAASKLPLPEKIRQQEDPTFERRISYGSYNILFVKL